MSGQERRRALTIAGTVALALLGLGYLLLGLPGALVFELSTLLVLGHAGIDDLEPDAAWPVAIVVSLAVPLVIPFATWLALRVRPGWPGRRVALVVAGSTLASAVAVSLALHALYTAG